MASLLDDIGAWGVADKQTQAALDLVQAFHEAKIADHAAMLEPKTSEYRRLKKISKDRWEEVDSAYLRWIRLR